MVEDTFTPGWDGEKMRRILAHYEDRSEVDVLIVRAVPEMALGLRLPVAGRSRVGRHDDLHPRPQRPEGVSVVLRVRGGHAHQRGLRRVSAGAAGESAPRTQPGHSQRSRAAVWTADRSGVVDSRDDPRVLLFGVYLPAFFEAGGTGIGRPMRG